jgi:hypothetical protein
MPDMAVAAVADLVEAASAGAVLVEATAAARLVFAAGLWVIAAEWSGVRVGALPEDGGPVLAWAGGAVTGDMDTGDTGMAAGGTRSRPRPSA